MLGILALYRVEASQDVGEHMASRTYLLIELKGKGRGAELTGGTSSDLHQSSICPTTASF